ncbi:MAG: hypothetical protein R8L07_17405 [Alphaproteobacteria bacterium]|nr:hypothetical protein [Alphaproteobacteria bacterium]
MPKTHIKPLLLLLLSGCVSAENDVAVAPAPVPATSEAAQTVEPPQPALPYPEKPPEPQKPATEVTIAANARTDHGPEPGKEAEVDKAASSAIIGESEQGIESMFGPPHDILPKFPGHIWKYVSDVCDVEIFFYLDIASDTYRVLTLDVTPETESENCYGSLANAKG